MPRILFIYVFLDSLLIKSKSYVDKEFGFLNQTNAK